MLKLFVSLLSAVLVVQVHATVRVMNEWPGGFQAEINLPVDTEKQGGWEMMLTFSEPCNNLQIWSATIVGADSGKELRLKNTPYNADLGAGSVLNMNFLCEVTGGTPAEMNAYFVGDGPNPTVKPTGPPATGQPPTGSPPGKYDYVEAIHQSIMFYEAQRSGPLPSSNRIPYRGTSCMGDRGHNGEDLTGGWFDAGDHVKFGFPMASTATMLAWGMVQFRQGYVKAGELSWALESIKWPLDYFIKCHVGDNEFYGQVGDGHIDHAHWGRPEEMTMERPAWKITANKPGTELAGESAAAMAAGSIVFKETDPGYAAKLLDHARRLYSFADKFRGKYTDAIPANDFYGSWGYEDELCWGAMWLYEATGEQEYLSKAEQHMPNHAPDTLSWDDKNIGCSVLHYKHTKSESSKQIVESFLKKWFRGGSIPYTPKGLAWVMKWGANRYAANSAMLAMVAADLGILTAESRDFAMSQINYVLGDGGRSYVCGFGNNPPRRPHHASSSCPWAPAPCNWNNYHSPDPNPHVLYGALVGGPDQNDNFEDRRDDYIKNEVATDYNAGFQGTLAGIIALQ